MTRTSRVHVPEEFYPGVATVLPGVPLPSWARHDEPAAPEPEPVETLAAEPVPDLQRELAPVGALALSTTPTLAPPVMAPPVMAPPVMAPPVMAPLPASPPPALAPPTLPDALSAPPSALAPPSMEELVLAPPLPTAASAFAPPMADAPPAISDFPAFSDFSEALPDPDAVVTVGDPSPMPVLVPAAGAATLADPSSGDADGSHTEPDAADAAAEGSEDTDDSRPSRRPLALMAVAGSVVVLGAVAAFVWPGLLLTHDVPAVAPIASPPTTVASSAVTLQTPTTVAGLTKLTGAPDNALRAAATSSALPGFTAPVSAVYGVGTTPGATVIAWTATSPATPANVSTAFAGFQSANSASVTAITPSSTPGLGGEMSCGVSVVTGTPATVCFWGDDASFGAITVLRPTSPLTGATTAAAIRAAVEKRG